uniref:Uncharacterized protein n=1 Tax=Davidia involucrata TaxID=16924 RepID=A0A5B7BH80_DAVIN
MAFPQFLSSAIIPFIFGVTLSVSIGLANARPGLPFHPCNTLLISYYISSSSSQNPYFSDLQINSQIDSNKWSLIFSRNVPLESHKEIEFLPEIGEAKAKEAKKEDDGPLSSLRDRAGDILSIVVALLFGVACGVVTSLTMYLIWSCFAYRYNYRRAEYDSDSDGHDDGDVFSPKKMGYAKIPVDAPGVAPAPAAKEVV